MQPGGGSSNRLQEEGRCRFNLGANGVKHGRLVEGLGGDSNDTFKGRKSCIWVGLLRTANEKERSLIRWGPLDGKLME